MCGIFGMISKHHDLTAYFQEGSYALSTLVHRGPDGINHFSNSNAFIGHTRLSIIDHDTGRQPMMSDDGDLVITFNGEIFNYRELKSELKHLGYTFVTQSDTEVILAAFKHYGHDCVDRFRGMFAFAIFNRKSGEIFAARDKFGIKPFFYTLINNMFIFSSEIKAIYKTGLVSFEPETKHFNEYLIFGYVAGEETLHKNIRELAPAHYLIFNAGEYETHQYWYPVEKQKSPTPDGQELEAMLEKKLREAVKFWITADVEVASFLSGGIDSSILTVLASGYIDQLKTFTACFPGDKVINETARVEKIIDRIKGVSLMIPMEDQYLFKNIFRLSAHVDDPIHDSNYFTLMALCEGIREHSDIKVVLCGEGADELFGGYDRHKTIPEKYVGSHDPEVLIYAMNRVALPRLRLFSENIDIEDCVRKRLFNSLTSDDPVNMALELDQLTFLTSYLHRQDRVGMMFGLEIRTPYLDDRLARFVNSLSSDVKVRNNCHKWILRKTGEKFLPKSIMWDKSKVALSFPIHRMLKQEGAGSLFRRMVNKEAALSSYYSVDGILKLLNDHNPLIPGKDHSNTLWRILSLELWLGSRN